ncbi:hypothetical protein ACFO3E_07090 [Sphingobium tyrosinilyticum]|uniref:DNA-directed DNA polymerase family A palm domain-containing protein n=2 Tax=Sphingobium tyrosinilyticum TaxID=2715436 RepID=A0ABV9EWC6_9SPHN
MDDAVYLSLSSTPTSAEVSSLIEALSTEIECSNGAQRKSPKLRRAIGALLADLLHAPHAFHYRSLHPKPFTGSEIGYKPTKKAIDGLKVLGYLDVRPGFRRSGPLAQDQKATRIRLQLQFLDYASSFGVCPTKWGDHFLAAPIGSYNPEPIQLRAQSERNVRRRRLSGKRLAINPDDAIAIRMGRRVNRINSLRPTYTLAAIETDGPGLSCVRSNREVHGLFFRSFTQIKGEKSSLNKGGRLYSQGRYQQFSRNDRATITIDGEATVEIDISACHLTIVYARNGMKLDAFAAYTIDGFPRAVIKSWVTMTLGHSKFHRAWPKATVDRMWDKFNGEINLRDYPIKDVEAAVLAKHPLLREWPSSPIRWGDLQYEESEVMIDTVYTLSVEHGIPALPVHDSIIVAASKIETAKDVLIAMFEKHIGVKPMLKTD